MPVYNYTYIYIQYTCGLHSSLQLLQIHIIQSVLYFYFGYQSTTVWLSELFVFFEQAVYKKHFTQCVKGTPVLRGHVYEICPYFSVLLCSAYFQWRTARTHDIL